MQDIHDIRPPVMVGLDPALLKLALIIGAGILVLLVLLFIARLYWKKKSPAQDLSNSALIPPYDEALKALSRLSLMPIHDGRAFYFDLGGLLKRYIGRSHGCSASEMTTPELIRGLRSTSMDDALVRRVSHFFTSSDPFRYSPLMPGPDLVKKDLEGVKKLINDMEASIKAEKELSIENTAPADSKVEPGFKSGRGMADKSMVPGSPKDGG